MDASLVFLFYFAALFGGVFQRVQIPHWPLFQGLLNAVFGAKQVACICLFSLQGWWVSLIPITPFFKFLRRKTAAYFNPGWGRGSDMYQTSPKNSPHHVQHARYPNNLASSQQTVGSHRGSKIGPHLKQSPTTAPQCYSETGVEKSPVESWALVNDASNYVSGEIPTPCFDNC